VCERIFGSDADGGAELGDRLVVLTQAVVDDPEVIVDPRTVRPKGDGHQLVTQCLLEGSRSRGGIAVDHS